MDVPKQELKTTILGLSFLPKGWPKEKRKKTAEREVLKLVDLAKKVRDELAASGIASWEVDLEGTLEASSGVLPGGKAGFTATLKLSSK